jgi:hypothetical protein
MEIVELISVRELTFVMIERGSSRDLNPHLPNLTRKYLYVPKQKNYLRLVVCFDIDIRMQRGTSW